MPATNAPDAIHPPEKHPPFTDELERPIFIAGAGRSGTTLLRSLLSAHSGISVTPETHFMERARNWGYPSRARPEDFDRFWARYTRSVRFRDQNVDADACRAVIEQGEPTFQRVFKTVLSAYLHQVGKRRVGEKTPGHVHFIPDLLSWFPDARILILRRDPRAVVASQLKSPWVNDRITPFSLRDGFVVGSRLHQLAYYAEDWRAMYEEIVPASIDDPRVRIVPYESLVQDAEGELRAVCEFLDESFEPTMLANRSDDTVPAPASTDDISDDDWKEWRREHHAKTLQPVSTKSLEKWKRRLSDRDVAMVEGHCVRGMKRFGYAPAKPPLQRKAGRAAVAALLGTESAESGVRDGIDAAWEATKDILRPVRSMVRAAS